MEWDVWIVKLCAELTRLLGFAGEEYVAETGDDCWREMFNDGLSPEDAAEEEWRAMCEASR